MEISGRVFDIPTHCDVCGKRVMTFDESTPTGTHLDYCDTRPIELILCSDCNGTGVPINCQEIEE